MGAAVEVKDLYVQYARAKDLALKGLSFTVEEGEFLAIVGPANAGKSTLCRCLSGLIPHSYEVGISGSVTVCGLDVRKSDVATISKHLRYVFEEPASQFIGMSVEEEVSFALETLGITRAEMEERVAWALEVTRMTPYRYKSPTELSGGQMQRVAIASALASRPKVLVLDEPTAELDPIGKAEVFEVIARLSRETSLTIVLVDQHSDQIVQFADRVMLMIDGQRDREGPPREFFADVKYLQGKGVGIPQVVAMGYLLCEEVAPVPLPFCLDEAQTLVEDLLGPERSFSPLPVVDNWRQASDQEKVLEVRDVKFQYPDGTSALNGVSFSVHTGEFVAIIGENGAGKTTLIKHLNRLLSPTSGQVLVKGRPTTEYSTTEMAKTVGFIFQNPDHQLCCQTVAEEVAFGLKLIGWDSPPIEQQVDRVLEIFGLTGQKNAHPHFLSKADRQRLAIASVMAMEPEILVVDEPTTGFDFSESNQFMSLLKSLNERGQTIVVITHEMDLVARYVPRTIVLAGGRILVDGPTREVFAQRELLSKSYVKPPQIADLAERLRPRGCPAILLPGEMVAAVKMALNNRAEGVD